MSGNKQEAAPGQAVASERFAAEAIENNCRVRALWTAGAAFEEGKTIDDNPFNQDRPELRQAFRDHFDLLARCQAARYGGVQSRADLW